MIMIPHEFRREEHVYDNSAFSELLKDAVRFFHGTPVLPLPLEKPFNGAGVYAIYCIAKKGLYKTYGESINRTSYDVPIYVGKAVPPGWRQNEDCLFSELSVHLQISFWRNVINKTIGMNCDDFAVRQCSVETLEAQQCEGVCEFLRRKFNPVWNSVFTPNATMSGIETAWRRFHSIRFASRACRDDQRRLSRLIGEVAA